MRVCERADDQAPVRDPAVSADIAYIGRHAAEGRAVVHIAGIHAIGSLGAVHYLAGQLFDLYAATGDAPVSMAVRAETARHLGLDDWDAIARSDQARLSALLQRCHEWEESADPDGRHFPRAKRHDDKAIATICLS